MTTLLRHKLTTTRAGKAVSVTVYPNDGRAVIETYRLSLDEARRFAWALLADLDPIEAARAAAEDGLDLAAASQPRGAQGIASAPPPRHRVLGERAPTLSPPVNAIRKALARLARAGTAGATFPELAEVMTDVRGDSAQRALVTRMMNAGHAQRANGAFRPALYQITPAGHAERARLDLLAATAPQRSAA